MSAAERFNVNFEVLGDRARVAMIGSEGTELLMILPFYAAAHGNDAGLESAVMKDAETRIKAALLALIGKNWPPQEI